jgi:tetratricopeptide (TPR) repeat protein
MKLSKALAEVVEGVGSPNLTRKQHELLDALVLSLVLLLLERADEKVSNDDLSGAQKDLEKALLGSERFTFPRIGGITQRVRHALAEVYFQQGMVREAAEQYKKLAEEYRAHFDSAESQDCRGKEEVLPLNQEEE